MIIRQEAEEYVSGLLEFALVHGREPGTWYKFHNHIYGVAAVAEKIAAKLGNLDPERAWALGLLHDAGKMQEPFVQRFHGIVGYEMLKERDELAARISLSHTFHFNILPPYQAAEKMFFSKKEDYDFIREFFAGHKVCEYDKLIQLCDGLANCNGLVTMEQRAEEFAVRYGMPLPAYVISGARKLKLYFDEMLGFDLYRLFDEISGDFMLQPGVDSKLAEDAER